MNPKISLSTLLVATLTSTFISTEHVTAEPSPIESATVLQEAVTIKFGRSGRYTWEGKIGDTITVTWTTRRGLETRTGTLRNVSRSNGKVLAVSFMESDNEVRTIFTEKITKITSASTNDTSSNSGEAKAATAARNGTSTPAAPSLTQPEPQSTHMLDYPTTPGPGLEDKWPKVFLLPFEGTVGSFARHNEIKQIGEVADQYGDGQIIVLLVDSPGGLVREGDEIHETLVDIQSRHTLVAWIRKAISAGAYTSFHCPQIVFMSSGAMGSITMFSGDKAIEGERLAAWVKEVGDAAAGADHSRELAEAMVTNPEMCSYDPADGDKGPVIYGTLEGEIVLSTDEENLTINASDAKACGFSIGTADTVEELAQILGLPRWYETTDDGRRIHKNWHRTLDRAKTKIPDLSQRAMGNLGSSRDQIKSLTSQISALRDLIKWYKILGMNTVAMMSAEYQGIAPIPVEQLEIREREMKEELARLRAQQRN